MSSTISSSSNSAVVAGDESKLTSVTELTKHKRRRRGKKRKFNKSDKLVNESDFSENNANNQTSDADENQALENDANNSHKRRSRGILIRPINVPKAPENSTQFIIDDHKGCGLYFSFETPNPYYKGEYLETEADADLCRIAEDAAFQDIDYKYESPQDLDDSAYYTQDFETAYNTSRYEELMRHPRQDLVSSLESLDSRLKELEEDLVKYDPNPVLEQLQHKLLNLQEENHELTMHNNNLKVMFSIESNGSASEQSLEAELSGNEAGSVSEMKEAVYADNVESTSKHSPDCRLSTSEAELSGNEARCMSDLKDTVYAENIDSTCQASRNYYRSPSDQSIGEFSENEAECIPEVKEDMYSEDVESASKVSPDSNLSAREPVGEQSLEAELSGNEAECASEFKEFTYVDASIDSTRKHSPDGNLSVSEVTSSNLERPEGSNADSVSSESLSEPLLDHVSSANEKTEYNFMSEKMSNVEIAEPVNDHVHL